MNKMIDHTLLKAATKKEDIKVLCNEAREYNFASVCVNPYWVSYAKELLSGSTVNICTVIGFPLGANTKEVKAFETKNAILNGATEIDMVLNIGALVDGDYEVVLSDIQAVVEAANGVLVKVIIEACLLSKEQKIIACELILKAGAQFVKSSTGFSTGGATKDDIELFKSIVGDKCLIKASGGVRSIEDVLIMTKAGASRIGTSGGVNIINGLSNENSY